MSDWGHLKELDIAGWLYALLQAMIGGGASAVTGAVSANIIDPATFNTQTGGFYKMAGALFAVNAMLSLFLYLKQSPLPAKKVTVHEVLESTHTVTTTPASAAKPSEGGK